MTKVLVTGAGGFLGTTLVNELCKVGVAVRVVLHEAKQSPPLPPQVETVWSDIRDARNIKEAMSGCNAVVHLAAKVHAIDDPGLEQDYYAINVEGTKCILDAGMVSCVKHVVFVSSVKVFGEETNGCIDESQAPVPQTPYGRSKWQAEQLVSEYAGRHGLTAVSLRLPMVYGPTQKGNLYQMIEAIDKGRFPALPRLPMVRSLLHVQNFVQAVLLCLRAPRFQRAAYIVADSHPYCVTDLYDCLRAGLGKSPARWRVPLWVLKGSARAGDMLQLVSGGRTPISSDRLTKLIGGAWFSAAAITRELGYQAPHSFVETVPELIAAYRKAASVRSVTNSYRESRLVR
jgi:UDP-glucose 4-epimerase